MSGGATAIYFPVEGLDVGPGEDLLRRAGVTVHHLDEPSLGPDAPRDAVALLVGYDPVGAAVMDELPQLRIIATHSDGYDMVDLEAARERGIWVAHLPDSACEEVAVHALTLTLSVLRRVGDWQRRVREGLWVEDDSIRLRRPSTLTCGVVGLGRIGGRYARLAAPIFGRTLGCDPYLPADRWPAGVAAVDVQTLFSQCDVVSLHVPLTDETRLLASGPRLESLPRGAVLVNVSRGELVDEAALLAALDSGRISGAGLDVLVDEPPAADNPLAAHRRVVLTPHIAYLSQESLARYAAEPAANVVALLEHGRPNTPVEDLRPGADARAAHRHG
ncbi:C-terminal binding protein [Intrasporangium sp.]|uniref:C-terminal binding protein n=1 Tax=Intrasporangium sp. TaxID=1925024 RepID=UPI003221A1C7